MGGNQAAIGHGHQADPNAGGQRGRVCKKEFVPTGNLSGGNCHDGATDRPSGASLAAWAGNETMQPQCEVASMGDCSLRLRQLVSCILQFSRSCGSGALELRSGESSQNSARGARELLPQIRILVPILDIPRLCTSRRVNPQRIEAFFAVGGSTEI